MALAAASAAMYAEEKKDLHPFFAPPSKPYVPEVESTSVLRSTDGAYDDADQEPAGQSATGEKKRRGRKIGSKNKTQIAPADKTQPSLDTFTGRLRVNNGGIFESATGHVEPTVQKEVQVLMPTRPSTTIGISVPVEDMVGAVKAPALVAEPKKAQGSSEGHLKDDLRRPNGAPIPEGGSTESLPRTPKKTLKISKNGKLLSSPTPAKRESDSNTPRRKRRRKASKEHGMPTIAIIKYGSNSESRRALGDKIDAILWSRNSTGSADAKVTKQSRNPGPSKPTHPFFLGKAAPVADSESSDAFAHQGQLPPSPRAQRRSAATPGKIRAEIRLLQSSEAFPAFDRPQKRQKLSEANGPGDAPWPKRDAMHVRDIDTQFATEPLLGARSEKFGCRKMKRNVPAISTADDLIHTLSSQLAPRSQTQDHDMPDSQYHSNLRLPTRLLTNGPSIQQLVRKQVFSTLLDQGRETDRSSHGHAAIQTIFWDIKDTLTPFDLGKCETKSWTQKYAPRSASHVLQTGPEPSVLRSWLQNLTVSAVRGKHESTTRVKASEDRPARKRRKKDPDDFIVDSDDEEEEEMIELERQEPRMSRAAPLNGAPSCRRAQWTRNKNVVVICGPTGCGKSALVYAVAKELGFEVFEINSGSRRSGKDIQDKIGDMAENHLVNHRNPQVSKGENRPADDTDSERNEEALKQDIASGRQGTMMSFFKSKGAAKTKPKSIPDSAPRKERVQSKSIQGNLLKTCHQQKSQKQSLILFEEADILFEDDQNFWPSVTRLAHLSKRPMIVTCNDEAAIPMEQLPLAAVLRLQAPPVDLVADYVLVMAAREGHVLHREAVINLYRTNKHDLRASINELDFWCQMSVGDRKGGLEWMYQRWPAGHDVDEHGQAIRVASKDTYITGMGIISHDVCVASDNAGVSKDEEVAKQAWIDWGISPTERTRPQDTLPHPANVQSKPILEQLRHMEALSECISAAEVYCRVDLPTYDQDVLQPTDPTLAPMRDAERSNYTIGAAVLQVDHCSDFAQIDTCLSVQAHLAAQRYYTKHIEHSTQDQPTCKAHDVSILRAILKKLDASHATPSLSWSNFSQAFDPLAYVPDSTLALNTSFNLTASIFDRTLRVIVEDVAPYVRSIVAHELVLEAQRLRLSNLLSEGGSAKRARTTRAARTALEGGQRETKRRERWFEKDLNRTLVMETAGKSWSGMASVDVMDGSTRAGESVPSTQGDEQEERTRQSA